jgi:hypothetical protein
VSSRSTFKGVPQVLSIRDFEKLRTPSDMISSDHQTRPTYEVVSKSFRTGRLERGLQMVQLPATRCSCIAIL